MNVLVGLGIEKEWKRLPAGINFGFCAADPDSIQKAMRDDVDVLVTDAMPLSDKNSRNLKWIQLASAGTDQLIGHPLVRKSGLKVTNSAGMCAVHIAEFVLARILYHTKSFGAFSDLQQKHTWPDRVSLSRPCLRNKTALLIGYGGVGRETARLLSAFGVNITAMDVVDKRTKYQGYMPFEGIGDLDAVLPRQMITAAGLETALPQADFVILSVPLTAATRHIINIRTLSVMKQSAILINVARGPVVNTDDLLVALQKEQIDHAYLDVFDLEPLSADSSLWDNKKISITPHMAGVMPDALLILEDLFLKNLERFASDQPLLNLVSLETYR